MESPSSKYDDALQVKCNNYDYMVKKIYIIHVFFSFILGAVQKKYESMRRQWVLDGKEGKDEV